MSARWKLLLTVPLALGALAAGGTVLYTQVIADDAPAALSLTGTAGTPSPSSSGTGAAGSWSVTAESAAGYRVDEVLFGQEVTAVGRTSEVAGSLTLDGTTVTAASFTVDMASVRSDQSRRDNQYRSRIMSTDRYRTATFSLTEPIGLASLPADGATVTADATGDLTLRGVTRSVTFDVTARRSGTRMEVSGSIPVRFAEFDIPSPSFGPAEVEDHGVVEFLLVLAPTATS